MNWLKQYKKTWIVAGVLLTPMIYWATNIATIAGPLLPYVFPVKSQDGVNPALLGNWYEEFAYPDRGYIVQFKGTIQYFANKAYRVSGTMEMVSTKPGTPYKAVYHYDGNGEWQATDEELIIKLLHLRAPLASTTLGTQTFPARAFNMPASMPGMDLGPDLELAQSQRYDIRSTSKNKVVLETNGIYGDTFTIDMIRTDKMYLR